MVRSMNCIWIILLLACSGGCGGNGNRSNCGNSNCNDNYNSTRYGNSGSCGNNSCRNAVENAVNECGSEGAVARVLRDMDQDCGCLGRSERNSEQNNGCNASGVSPSHWQDFPSVASADTGDDCGCND